MGDFSMTCSVSGLGIGGGTPVRCLLLVASPYGDDHRRGAWLVRTPPLRAVYDNGGSIRDVHPDDDPIADLWLRGLREDLVEKGLGDNPIHDVPVRADASFEDLLDALRAHRVEVRQDVRHFWRRAPAGVPDQRPVPFLSRVEEVLRVGFPDGVSRVAAPGQYVADEPVPGMVRVRHGQYEHDDAHLAALDAARALVERAGLAGVVTAGSGRYPGSADLLVFRQPRQGSRDSTRGGVNGPAALDQRGRERPLSISGPQWDLAPGQEADPDKHLRVGLAMIREDVWGALVSYPHDDLVAHGPVFPEDVEHVLDAEHPHGETVWYGSAAWKAGTRETWRAILRHLRGEDEPKNAAEPGPHDDALEALFQKLEAASAAEHAQIEALPAAERAALEEQRRADREAWEAWEKEKEAHPHFGDFLIGDHVVHGSREPQPGAWIFYDSTPGVIGVRDHLSMCLADRVEVTEPLLDALAELSMVSTAMNWVGVTWKPAVASGPQYPEWGQHARFARTILTIAEAELAAHGELCVLYPATLAEVTVRIQGTRFTTEQRMSFSTLATSFRAAAEIVDRTCPEDARIGLRERIRRYAELPDGWDGPGSLRPSKRAIAAAQAIVMTHHAVASRSSWSGENPQVAPLTSGGLQFEWHVAERELYTSCDQDGGLGFLEVAPGHEREYTGGLVKLVSALEWLFDVPGQGTRQDPPPASPRDPRDWLGRGRRFLGRLRSWITRIDLTE